MKLLCKFCGEMMKYKYMGCYAKGRKRFMVVECPRCRSTSASFGSDPAALKYWNEENVR